MPCFHPLPAWRSPLGVLSLREPQAPAQGTERLRLPCGSCIGCRTSRAREWAFRCQLEAKRHDEVCWATLTYNDENLPPTLSKPDVSGFLKRLRSRVHPRRVRFFACGEYGERNHRPHYHAILFGLSTREVDADEITAAWGKGFTRVDPLTPAAIAYVAGYVAKKIGWQLEKGERMDPTTGELYEWQPPFTIMSRNPGIAGHAREHWQSWRLQAIYDGQPIPVPRYLHNAYLENATPTELTKLKQEKDSLPLRDSTKDRLLAAEAQAIARHNLKSQRRKL